MSDSIEYSENPFGEVRYNMHEPSFYTSQLDEYLDKMSGDEPVFDEVDFRTMAGLLRIAESKKPVRKNKAYLLKEEKQKFVNAFNAFEAKADLQNHSFGFEIATNFLTFGYDDQDGWKLSKVSDERKKWCVDQILGRLGEIEDESPVVKAKTLEKVRGIITRANPEATAFGEVETYLNLDDLAPVVEFLDKSENLAEQMEEGHANSMEKIVDAFNEETKKNDQEVS